MALLLILPAAAILLLAAAYGVYRVAFHSPDRKQNDDYSINRSPQMEPLRETVKAMIDELNAIPYERVSIRSADGLRLAGRYYHQRDGAPLGICFHGWRGTPSRDFSGGTRLYFSEGWNLLMAEQRAQCGSEGHTMTFGVRERQDCLLWARYAAEHFGPDTEILLTGISMGAATVLMASALELPENVRGIIADCPFTTPRAIIGKVCGDIRIPAGAAWPLVRLGARLFGGFDPADPEADAAAAVKKARVPILVIHGEDDRFVPCGMSRAIAASNPALVELHTFPGAGHGLSYLVDKARYEEVAKAFCRRVLGRAPATPGEADDR